MTQLTNPTSQVNDGGAENTTPANSSVDPSSVLNPPNNPAHTVLPDNHPVVVALNSAKQKNQELTGQLSQIQGQLNLVTASLGQIDPTRLSEIQDAVRAQSQMEEKMAAIRAQAAAEVEAKYVSNVDKLTASLNSSQNQLQQVQQSNSLQALFAQCGGQDFTSFKALMDSRFNIEYGESASPFTPPPIKAIYNSNDGSPVMTEEGRPLAPNEVLMLLRQGKLGGQFGNIIANTFLPYNQANGNGYAPSTGDPGTGEANPFLSASPNMTTLGQFYRTNPSRALALAKEAKNPKLAGLVKAWEAAAKA